MLYPEEKSHPNAQKQENDENKENPGHGTGGRLAVLPAARPAITGNNTLATGIDLILSVNEIVICLLM